MEQETLVPQSVAQHRSRQKTMLVDGRRMAYVDEGPRQGSPILLVHGMPTSSWLYRRVVPRLTTHGLRVIAPDLLGFGASDKPDDLMEYAIHKQAARLLALMRHLGLSRWTQVCHDMGGPWTWEILDLEPERIERLVILNTTAYRGPRPPLSVRMMGGPLGAPALWAMGHHALGPALVGSFFKSFVAHPEDLSRAAIEGYWRPFREGTTRAFRQFAKSFDHTFAQSDRYRAALRRADMPAMIIWGQRDPILSHAELPARFARDLRIPPERISILADASHFLQEDQPDAIAQRIVEFVCG